MTIETTASSVSYTGNGVTTSWPYTFLIPDADSLVVVRTTIATGTEIVLDPSLYSVTGLGVPAGGAVTYPISGTPLSSAYRLTVRREVAYTQETSIVNQSGFYPQVIENALDRATMQIQQLRFDLDDVEDLADDLRDEVDEHEERIDSIEGGVISAGNYLAATTQEHIDGSIVNKFATPGGVKAAIEARVGLFATKADAAGATIASDVTSIQLLGRLTQDDAIEARYDEVDEAPDHGEVITNVPSGRVFAIVTRRPDAFQFGARAGTGNGSYNVDAIQSGLAYCAERGLTLFDWPPGGFYFDSWPGVLNDYGGTLSASIVGAGQEHTTFYKNYAEAVASRGLFHWEGGWEDEGARLSNCTIIAQTGSSGGCAISLVPTGNPGTYYSTIEKVRITSGPINGWKYGVYLDGELNATDPKGVRNILLNDVDIFGCEEAVLRAVGVTNLRWRGNSGADTGSGAASGDIEIVGISAGFPTRTVIVDLNNCDGTLVLGNHILNSFFRSPVWGNITNTVTCTNVIVMGDSTGGCEENWDKNNCRHIPSGHQFGSAGTSNWMQLGDSSFILQTMKPDLTTSQVAQTFPLPFQTGTVPTVVAINHGTTSVNTTVGTIVAASAEAAASSVAAGELIAVGRKVPT